MLRLKSLVHNGGIGVCGLRALRAASVFERLLSSAANAVADSSTETSPPLGDCLHDLLWRTQFLGTLFKFRHG